MISINTPDELQDPLGLERGSGHDSVGAREIDQLVYMLYDLTPEEIAIVEEATRGK